MGGRDEIAEAIAAMSAMDIVTLHPSKDEALVINLPKELICEPRINSPFATASLARQ
jgi:hypothetical protein